MFTTILTFVIVLSVIVFAHECGHFFMARRAGIKVEEFGFGFPPRLWGKKHNDMIWSINAIPIGGFVRLKGEGGENAKDSDSFSAKSGWQRMQVIVAGVVMNFILAWVLFSIGYMFGLPQIVDDESPVPSYATVSQEKLHVVNVLEGTPAAAAGIEIGDVIWLAEDERMTNIEGFALLTGSRGNVPMDLVLEREGEQVEVSVAPAILEITGKPGIGVSLMKTGMVAYPVYMAPIQGLWMTGSFTYQILIAFGTILGDLFTGGGAPADISGPVGIAVVAGEVAQHGWRHLLQFIALLSINLGILNILPFPALDGGRLLFLIIEKIRGRAVSRQIEAMIHNVGFALLMLLVLVVTYGDVVRFGDRIMQSITNVFTG